MRGQTYIILMIIFGILIAWFAVSNVEVVEVSYFFWKRESPLILVILFSVLLGGILTTVAGSVKVFNLIRKNKQLNHEVKQLTRIIEEEGLEALLDQEKSSDEKNMDD